MVITSIENEKIKNLVKLQKKKYRDLTNTYLIEGEHLVNEAIKAGTVLEIFLLENESFLSNLKINFVSYEVMKKISTLDSIPKIVALCKKNNNKEIIGNKI